MGQVIRWLLDNSGTLLLAVILAVLVWVVAEQEANPNQIRTVEGGIDISLLNKPDNMIVYGQSAEQVRVTLSAPSTSWDVMTTDRISATIDLSDQTAGTLELPVNVTVADRFARVVRVEPAVISLKYEPLIDKTVPVSINVVGSPALGYSADPIEIAPPTVMLRGPASTVGQVAVAAGQLSILEARGTVSQTVTLTPRNADGQIVANVTLSPTTALGIVRVEQLGGFRDLAVKVDLRGNVATGYLIGNVSVRPQVVTVFGSPTVLDAQPGFITTEPVTVTDATDDINERVRLSLPSGVSMLGDPFVEVGVKVDAIESSLRLQRAPQPQGLQPDLFARLSPELVDVIISGPIPQLDTLDPENVVVVLNLLGLEVGTHQITPEVNVPSGLRVISVLPASVQVVITDQPITPTITATLPISPSIVSPLPTPQP